MGIDATLYLDRVRHELIPERNKTKAEQEVIGTGPRGQGFYDKPRRTAAPDQPGRVRPQPKAGQRPGRSRRQRRLRGAPR